MKENSSKDLYKSLVYDFLKISILCYNKLNINVNGGIDMFTKEELLVIRDAFKVADDHYMKVMEDNMNNKNIMVSYNRKQKKLWMVQNKLNKLIEETK